jgi:hypothetical protein
MIKTGLFYIGMLGSTLFGIWVIIRLGSGLQAPMSVEGTWELELTQPEVAAQCEGLSGWVAQPKMRINQSGPDLTIQLNNTFRTTFSGKLIGATFAAVADGPANTGEIMQLSAQIDRTGEPDRLQGLLTNAKCGASVQVIGTSILADQPASGGF